MPQFRWFRTTDGQDLLEYALLGAFLALTVLAGSSNLGVSVNQWFVAVAGVVGGDDEDGGGKKSNCSARGMIASQGRCHGG